MENKKFNIAEILKNAPKGIELYSPLFGTCSFVAVEPSIQPFDDANASSIHVRYNNGRDWYFNEYGECFYENSECLLFPSQSYRTWKCWQTELLPKSIGSVVKLDSIGTKFIIQKSELAENAGGLYLCVTNRVESCNLKYCDEQETKLYMTSLNENGKMWSSSEEKIVLISDKYKEGDTLLLTNTARHTDMIGCEAIVFGEVGDYCNSILYFKRNRNDDLFTRVKISNEQLVNDFVNVGNDLESPTFKDVVTEEMKMTEDYLCNDTFTTANFKPFDKVLVRFDAETEWHPDFFVRLTGVLYECIGSAYNSMCVPYNDETKHLLFTQTDYEGKYKTWK